MRKIQLRNGSIDMHWGELYPNINDVWLAYFKDDSTLYVCRVANVDDLGGNLVELTLQRASAAEPQRFRDEVDYHFLTGDQCTVESFEVIDRVKAGHWYSFLDKGRCPLTWKLINERLHIARFPESDGKGGYTPETIAYSLSREYDGP